jgi:hypothetical protein
VILVNNLCKLCSDSQLLACSLLNRSAVSCAVKFVCNKSANGTTVAESTAWLMYATVLHADVKSAWLMDKVAYVPPAMPPHRCACASYPQGCSAQQGVSVVPSCRTNPGPCSCRAHTQSPTPLVMLLHANSRTHHFSC